MRTLTPHELKSILSVKPDFVGKLRWFSPRQAKRTTEDQSIPLNFVTPAVVSFIYNELSIWIKNPPRDESKRCYNPAGHVVEELRALDLDYVAAAHRWARGEADRLARMQANAAVAAQRREAAMAAPAAQEAAVQPRTLPHFPPTTEGMYAALATRYRPEFVGKLFTGLSIVGDECRVALSWDAQRPSTKLIVDWALAQLVTTAPWRVIYSSPASEYRPKNPPEEIPLLDDAARTAAAEVIVKLGRQHGSEIPTWVDEAQALELISAINQVAEPGWAQYLINRAQFAYGNAKHAEATRPGSGVSFFVARLWSMCVPDGHPLPQRFAMGGTHAHA